MARKKLDTLTEPMYYVLLSLVEERHGYGVMQYASQLTGGRVAFGIKELEEIRGQNPQPGENCLAKQTAPCREEQCASSLSRKEIEEITRMVLARLAQ